MIQSAQCIIGNTESLKHPTALLMLWVDSYIELWNLLICSFTRCSATMYHALLKTVLLRKKRWTKWELKRIWSCSEVMVIPIVIGPLGTISKNFNHRLVNTSRNLNLETPQKTCLLGMARIWDMDWTPKVAVCDLMFSWANPAFKISVAARGQTIK